MVNQSGFLLDNSAIQEREECTQLLAAWFVARKLCRTPEGARRLAEEILKGNLEALAND